MDKIKTRIYIEDSIENKKFIETKDKEILNVAKVLALKPHDKAVVFNKSSQYLATITEIKKNSIKLEIDRIFESKSESKLKIHLIQGITKGPKMDFIIQKAVELGVSSITPFIPEKLPFKLEAEKKSKRWEKIIIEAVRQCQSPFVPELKKTIKLQDIEFCPPNAFILEPFSTETFKNYTGSKIDEITLVIGHEFGLSPQELDHLEKIGFKKVSMNENILRVETAVISALSIVKYIWD